MRAGIFGAALELADEAGLGWRLANIDADLVQGIHAVGGLLRAPRGEGLVGHVYDDPHPAAAGAFDRRRRR
ncbi:hypothetical protein U6X29_06650 [Cutibacterium acnes]|jgi:hypothetical protein|uniref:hypothetical protein n=1 Tax=Cutibacterium granulosum TaxID=33011 RepID=UPI0006BA5615|nr:hypothetical protein [Cutibacterium granulosum]KPG64795.1 hypothetical protein AK827_11785 [Cutibacterium acnes]KPG67484.1 hypothetical protein AK828_05100 [Cutibacterium acnes]MEA5643042.1 hypothetical protein [Cutibacterium granulosum]MEA5646069.1 hypothetical protein [Cutibacterium granulosum]